MKVDEDDADKHLLEESGSGLKESMQRKWQSCAITLYTVRGPDNKHHVCVLLSVSPDTLPCVWVKNKMLGLNYKAWVFENCDIFI